MTGNLLGEEINPIVDTQIKFRQQIQGAGYLENQSVERSPEVLNYLNNRNSWIKFASGVSISGSAGEEKLRDFFNDEGSSSCWPFKKKKTPRAVDLGNRSVTNVGFSNPIWDSDDLEEATGQGRSDAAESQAPATDGKLKPTATPTA